MSQRIVGIVLIVVMLTAGFILALGTEARADTPQIHIGDSQQGPDYYASYYGSSYQEGTMKPATNASTYFTTPNIVTSAQSSFWTDQSDPSEWTWTIGFGGVKTPATKLARTYSQDTWVDDDPIILSRNMVVAAYTEEGTGKIITVIQASLSLEPAWLNSGWFNYYSYEPSEDGKGLTIDPNDGLAQHIYSEVTTEERFYGNFSFRGSFGNDAAADALGLRFVQVPEPTSALTVGLAVLAFGIGRKHAA